MIGRIFYVSFVVAIMLSSCANKTDKNILPSWINNPLKNCSDGYMCAVGEGNSVLSSSANARNELAKQFSVNIKSDNVFSITQENDKDTTKAFAVVNENVDDIISGAIIKETYHAGNGSYYAMAVINRRKLEQELLTEINDIDKNLQLEMQAKPIPVRKINTLLIKRDEKNSRYIALTGKFVNSVVTMNDVMKSKEIPNFYKLDIDKNETLNIKDFIRNEIVNHLDKISKNSTKVITGKVNIDKQYLNVNGFEKYEIDVVLTCKEGDKVLGSIKITKSEIGRNKQQALDTAKDEIYREIREKIDSLLM